MNSNLTAFFEEVTGYRIGDIENLLSEADSFNVDFFSMNIFDEQTIPNINYLYERVYKQAIENLVGEDVDIDSDDNPFSMYCNCLDSHLYVDNNEVYDADDLQREYDEWKKENNPDEDNENEEDTENDEQ